MAIIKYCSSRRLHNSQGYVTVFKLCPAVKKIFRNSAQRARAPKGYCATVPERSEWDTCVWAGVDSA
jgi:hypothetical protein